MRYDQTEIVQDWCKNQNYGIYRIVGNSTVQVNLSVDLAEMN